MSGAKATASGETGMDGGASRAWDEARVKALLVEAAETLAQMDGIPWPGGHRSGMPPVVLDQWEAALSEAERMRQRLSRPVLPEADRARRERLDMVEQWLKRLPPAWYRIVWMRSFHEARLQRWGWRAIGLKVQMSHEAARYTYGHALARLVGIANGGVCAVETPLFA